MQAGTSYGTAVKQMLAIQQQTITQETEATYDNLSRIAKEKLNEELAEIKQIAQNEAEAESRNKFNAGDFGDLKSSHAERAKYKYEITRYEAKSAELNERITALTKEDAEKHSDKIAALKKEAAEFDILIAKAEEAKNNVKNTTAEIVQKTAEKVQEYGHVVNQAMSGISGIAADILGIQQQKNTQRLAEKLADIEAEKNARLMELETEYLDWKEEKQLEQQEREEERAEAEYEKQQETLTRSLNETQAAFNQETNIQKAKNKEKELEEKRRAKAEAEQKKKEADAEKKR